MTKGYRSIAGVQPEAGRVWAEFRDSVNSGCTPANTFARKKWMVLIAKRFELLKVICGSKSNIGRVSF